MNDGIQDVIWRLTVRDPQGKIVYGPRVHLADKTMIAAVKRWTGKDVTLLREYAIRGAWQNVDAVPVTGAKNPWHEEAPIFPDDDEMTPEEQAAWDALTPEEQVALAFAPVEVPPLPTISVPRGGIRWPQPLSQEEWERRAAEYPALVNYEAA